MSVGRADQLIKGSFRWASAHADQYSLGGIENAPAVQ
jgi:hypothetical protein